MHSIKENKTEIIKESPNWEICSLYNERQLIKNKKRTKYFIPFDSVNPPKSKKYFLHISLKNEDQIQTYELEEPSTLIGRENFCNFRFYNQKVGRQHFVIQFRRVKLLDENEFQIIPYIFDLNSKNGTFLNGSKIKSMRYIQLYPKDIISFEKSFENSDFLVIQEQDLSKFIKPNYDD